VVEFLVKEGGAEVNMPLQYGKYQTALHAAENGQFGYATEMVKLLIKYGAKRELSQSRVEEQNDSDDNWVDSDFSTD
jgi:hypothetical protein